MHVDTIILPLNQVYLYCMVISEHSGMIQRYVRHKNKDTKIFKLIFLEDLCNGR